MAFRSFFLVVCAILPLAHFSAAAVSPDTVVATVNGEKLTAGDIDRIAVGAPADMQEQIRANPKQFIEQYSLVSFLAAQGEEERVGDRSPYKEQLNWNRMQVLLQAAIAHHSAELQASGAEKAEVATRMQQWLSGLSEGATATFESEDYFSGDLETAAEVALETVVSKVNGQPLTAAEVKSTLMGAAERVRDNFLKNRKQFFREYALMLRLVEIAGEQGLADKTPYKEQLVWVRSNIMMQARLNAYSDGITIDREAEREYYAANQDKYTRAKVKVIYIPFGGGEDAGKEVNGKRVLTESEAAERAESIRKQVLGGADFVELVAEHSEDKHSREKDGDFGSIKRSDKIPDHIKDAIFTLKAGEISKPVRQPNGFYVFRVEEIGTQTIDEVRQTMNREAKSAKFSEWFDEVRKAIQVTYENEEYFAGQQ